MRIVCAALLVLSAPASAQTTLTCRGAGTVTNYSGNYSADQSAVVNFSFDATFDEAAKTMTARLPEVDYLRHIRSEDGLATAEGVTFTESAITAKFKRRGPSALKVAALGPFAFVKGRMPELVINRMTGNFSWGPHSGQCTPVTTETRQF